MKRTCLLLLTAVQLFGLESLSQRLAHTDPSKFKVAKAVHGGAGTLNYTALLSEHSLETNLNFFHRGILNPHSGAGNHLHYFDDEMYFILDGEAQFTVDGRTSTLKGPAGALCPLGHSHALYNATDKPIEWMNISVSSIRGKNSSYNMNDTMEKVAVIDPIPYFVTMTLNHSLLRPVQAMNGGTGTVQYRRALQPQNFSSPWAYVDDLVLPPGSSVGKHMHREVAEVFYVVSGQGSFSVPTEGGADETVSIHSGDAIPLRLNEVHSFKNTGSEPLEFMVIGVSRDPARTVDSVDVTANGSSSQ
ncbi:MAG: cupin domain-containing protein [Bryobacteraceae bacterium]